jgi:hypothetical protein
LYGEGKALGAFKELCIDPLIERVSGVQLTTVSSEYIFRMTSTTNETSLLGLKPPIDTRI